ncbi:signal recognition particle protein, partial [Streptosporangium lutulentum]|uniref:signal recognition particle protein n=1 Tax=Streptosporangium lutulentum TaxID=1461250 RepID=UPI003632BB17
GAGDPVAVARQSIDHAKRQQHDIVIIDTAGRLGIDQELMRQAADIRDAVTPDEVLFVVDAMIGQDAVSTAQAFMEGVGFDGVVLTKLDGDARGGAALSVRHITGKPIIFASTGEKLEDFDAFHPDRMASRILDMGDILTLIEQAQKTFDEAEAAKMAGKLTSGEGFTLEDFLEQMMMVQKMGPIKNLLGMMPGMGQMRDQLNQVDDRDLDRVAAIIRSMTPGERQNPKMIDGSRRARIAKGSGVTVTEVSGLVTRFFDAQKMMKRMAGGMGIPGMPGSRKAGKAAQKKAAKGRRVSGDPRKAGLPKGGSDTAGTPAAPGAGGLLGNLGGKKTPPGLELPPGFDPSKFKLPGQK